MRDFWTMVYSDSPQVWSDWFNNTILQNNNVLGLEVIEDAMYRIKRRMRSSFRPKPPMSHSVKNHRKYADKLEAFLKKEKQDQCILKRCDLHFFELWKKKAIEMYCFGLSMNNAECLLKEAVQDGAYAGFSAIRELLMERACEHSSNNASL